MITLNGVGNVTLIPLSSDDFYHRQLIIIIFIAIFCIFFITLNILIIVSMRREKEYKKLTAYQLMVQIGYTDVIQLVGHLTAVYYLLRDQEDYGVVPKIIGALMNASWATMLILSILLVFNRFITVLFDYFGNMFCAGRIVWLYIVIPWLFWVCNIVCHMFGLINFYYVVPLYTWHYEVSGALSAIEKQINANLAIVEVIVAIICYSLIFSYIYLKSSISSKRELRLTIQVLSVSLLHVLGFLVWNYVPIPSSPWADFASHFIWMLLNAVNPIMYLLINPRIRANFLSLIQCGKNRSTLVSRIPDMTSVYTTK